MAGWSLGKGWGKEIQGGRPGRECPRWSGGGLGQLTQWAGVIPGDKECNAAGRWTKEHGDFKL